MFSRILFPTDFSDVSVKAAAYVTQLKAAGATEVVVLHILDKEEAPSPGFYDAAGGSAGVRMTDAVQDHRRHAREACGRIVDDFQKAGLSARAAVEVGKPVDVILQMADADEVSLIVIGSTVQRSVKEKLLGSVSEGVLRRAKQPVLVVKP